MPATTLRSRVVPPKKTVDPTKKIYQIVGGVVAFGLFVVALAAILSRTPSATVSGRVTFQGRPVIWGSVIVMGQNGRAASGSIEPDGTYRVENAPIGSVTVGVISHDPLVQNWSSQLKKSRNRPTAKLFTASPVDRRHWFPLPQQFEEPASSGISFSLTKGSNERDIALP